MGMEFSMERAIEILKSTPDVLFAMMGTVSVDWTNKNEGGDTWSAYDVVGHLIHGERTDWIPRVEIILSNETKKSFKSFDRFAQFKDSEGKTLFQLLEEFKALRNVNVKALTSKGIKKEELRLKGKHPALGEVTLSQLIATWVVHDLDHIAQISRIMAKQYNEEVGPWVEYLRVLK